MDKHTKYVRDWLALAVTTKPKEHNNFGTRLVGRTCAEEDKPRQSYKMNGGFTDYGHIILRNY